LIKNQKDLASGLMFTIVGVAFAIGAREYTVGTAARMGPGYFPLLLGVILAILGLVITLQSLRTRQSEGHEIGAIAWRPLFFIIISNLAFGVCLGGLPSIGVPPLGLFLGIVALTFLACLAGGKLKLKEAVILSAVLIVGSYATFILLLKLPFQMWPAFIG
jgi:Tripartite tricarboxylate transporter TctB family